MKHHPSAKPGKSFGAAYQARAWYGNPPLAYSVLLAASLLVRCGGVVNTDSTRRHATFQEAGVTASGGSNGSSPGMGGVVIGAGGVTSAGGVFMVAPIPSPPPAAPGPVPCRSSASGEDCPLPPSTCDDSMTLAYYTDPACPAGACEWIRKTFRCGDGCAGDVPSELARDSGGCRPTRTAPPIGPEPPSAAPCSGSDASGCSVPPSICLNPQQLMYFDNPLCIAGSCQSAAHVRDCSWGCVSDECMTMPTR